MRRNIFTYVVYVQIQENFDIYMKMIQKVPMSAKAKHIPEVITYF